MLKEKPIIRFFIGKFIQICIAFKFFMYTLLLEVYHMPKAGFQPTTSLFTVRRYFDVFQNHTHISRSASTSISAS